MRKTIEIITHVYAMELPLYAGAFQYHLSSLVLHKPKECDVIMTVVYEPNDKLVTDILDWFVANTDIRFKTLQQEKMTLGRRSIGRNIMAKESWADIVWFADGDFCFGDGCLDELAALPWPDDACMVFPTLAMIHKDHAIGDVDTTKVMGKPGIYEIELGGFIPNKYSFAIGGIQIVQGDTAREWGYLDGEKKWQRPMPYKPFKDTLDDKAYRHYLSAKTGKTIQRVKIPNLFRIRQTRNARDEP